ncbi:MAG: hypothetical protein GKR77_02855 [Legionellales bacterium]|nr:hypothetical protein [Legionellales bacterium]
MLESSRLDKVVWTVLGVFIVVLVYLLTPTPVERPARGEGWFGTVDPSTIGFVYTLVIDIEKEQRVTGQQVLRGQSSFLAYAPLDETGNRAMPPMLTFENMLNISEFDANQDGFIDASDPDFKDFYLATFNQRAKTLVVLPLTSVGIAAFSVYSDHLTMSVPNDSKPQPIAGEVVLVDNSRWPLQLVPVDIQYFLELATIEWR